MKEYYSKQYMIYLARWIFSAIIMMPIMVILQAYLPLVLNLVVGQIFGSIIFFKIDKWIFREDVDVDLSVHIHPASTAPYNVSPEVSERKL